MATQLSNLSDHDPSNIPSGAGMRIALVVSEWNEAITGSLAKGAFDTLVQYSVDPSDIIIKHVPGSFELPMGAQLLLDSGSWDAIILLGCVIQGETRHFDFICDAVANGITTVGLKYNKPVIFGVLTTNSIQQALDRAGGKHGNKGEEAAISAIKMLGF